MYTEQKESSGTRYLGCSGNVPIFSDNLAAAGDKPDAHVNEQATNCHAKNEEPARAIAA
jgi:hypothetical protein